MKNTLTLIALFVFSIAFSQEYKTINEYSFNQNLDLDKNEKIFQVLNLKIDENKSIKAGDVIIIGTPLSERFNTVFIDKFSKKSIVNFTTGNWSPLPIYYKNSEFTIEEILLVNVRGKLTPIINFKKDQLKGFCMAELSLKNNEITLK